MKINTAKSALKQSNPEKAACTAPLMESSAESRPNAPASIHEPQQRDYFTQWWNEYQRKMRVRFQPELLKPKANINQEDFQESCPVSPSVAPYGTSKPADRATESRSSCEQPYRTTATRMVLAAWLPFIFHASTAIAPRQVDGPRASQAAGTFLSIRQLKLNRPTTLQTSAAVGQERCYRNGIKGPWTFPRLPNC